MLKGHDGLRRMVRIRGAMHLSPSGLHGSTVSMWFIWIMNQATSVKTIEIAAIRRLCLTRNMIHDAINPHRQKLIARAALRRSLLPHGPKRPHSIHTRRTRHPASYRLWRNRPRSGRHGNLVRGASAADRGEPFEVRRRGRIGGMEEAKEAGERECECE